MRNIPCYFGPSYSESVKDAMRSRERIQEIEMVRRGSPDKTFIEISAHKLKASLPSEHAATIGEQLRELVSPFVQAAGLVSDYLSFFRQRAALKAMKRVHELAKEQGVKLRPVPPRFLVPWMEAASLEDGGDDLADMWARLLLQASKDPKSAQPVFIDTLKRLTEGDARELEALWERYRDQGGFNPITATKMSLSITEQRFFDELRKFIAKSSSRSKSALPGTRRLPFSDGLERHTRRYLSALQAAGIEPLDVEVKVEFSDTNISFGFDKLLVDNSVWLARLAALQCVQQFQHVFSHASGTAHISGLVRYCSLTPYGHDFIRACHGLQFGPKRKDSGFTVKSHGFVKIPPLEEVVPAGNKASRVGARRSAGKRSPDERSEIRGRASR